MLCISFISRRDTEIDVREEFFVVLKLATRKFKLWSKTSSICLDERHTRTSTLTTYPYSVETSDKKTNEKEHEMREYRMNKHVEDNQRLARMSVFKDELVRITG